MIEPQVILLEDDAELRSLVSRALGEEGFEVTSAATAAELLRRLGDGQPDVLVVDIGLPDADGRDVVQAIRAQGSRVPVLFLTARDALPDRLSGFAAGGDDYLTKPFAFAELVARLHALVRRGGTDLAIETHGLRLDPGTHAVSREEFRILACLAGAPGDVVRRRDLVRAGWPHGAIVHDNTLDVYVARLRRKLGGLGGASEIATVHGVGYSLR
jgi:two-component system response regulator MprA